MPSAIYNYRGRSLASLLSWGDFHFGIFESRTMEVRFERLRQEIVLNPENYSAGLLFGPNAELRWRERRNGDLHAVYIQDGGNEPWEGAKPETLQPLKGDGLPDRIVLWGEPDGDTWYESRIPYPISYPQEFSGRRIAINIRHYQFNAGGKTIAPARLFRCTDLEAL